MLQVLDGAHRVRALDRMIVAGCREKVASNWKVGVAFIYFGEECDAVTTLRQQAIPALMGVNNSHNCAYPMNLADTMQAVLRCTGLERWVYRRVREAS